MRSVSAGGGNAYLRLFAVGLAGVVSLIPEIAPLTARKIASDPEFPHVPFAFAVGLDLLQPLVLLALASWVGVRLSPSVGFQSRIAGPIGTYSTTLPFARTTMVQAISASLLVAIATQMFDRGFQPAMGVAWDAYISENPATPWSLLTGLLYGGVTEEIIMRWGGMTSVVWVIWRWMQRGRGLPSPSVVWSAILISALLFGASHLPAVSTVVSLTTIIVVRTLALNAIGGVVFGWFYWKRGLEAAMLCHAMVHLWFAVFDAAQRSFLRET